MKVLIIENTKRGEEMLAGKLRRLDGHLEILGTINSLPSALEFFRDSRQPDILFFETDEETMPYQALFAGAQVACPVVFLVAPGMARKEMLVRNSISILEVPVGETEIKACLRHYREMQDFFMRHHSSLFEHFSGNERVRSRILIRKGTEYQTFRTKDIVYFFSDHKLVFLVDKENRKYLSTAKSLTDLLPQLDQALFYRANRKFIVNSGYVLGFTRAPDGRFILRLSLPVAEPILISQPNTSAFQHWMGEKL